MAIRVKRSVSVGATELYVEGFGMDCPSCGQHVPSGHTHRCEVKNGVRVASTSRVSEGLADTIRKATR